MRRLGALLACLLGAAGLLPAERWQMQYFYDEDRTSLTLVDLKFPSARRGIAVGYIQEKESQKPVSLITDDAGAHWTTSPLKENPISLFFFNDSLGWLVTEKGIWQTEEAGRAWRKKKVPQGILSVYFVTPDHGWAIGARNQAYETTDGATTWKKLEAVDEIKANAEYTTFSAIDFVDGKMGLIAGWNRPPRRVSSTAPEWADPASTSQRRAWPGLTVLLDTRDGGAKWVPSTASVFGQITRLKLAPDGAGLGLLEYHEAFEYPSEVIFISWKTGKSTSTYRDKARHITDLAMTPRGERFYLAGVEQTGKIHAAPVPSKVVMLSSANGGATWTEAEVDYRAVARRLKLATAPGGGVWAATDTGMILKLTPQ